MKRRVDRAIMQLVKNPFIGKPLRGELVGLWSLRVGDYRVIYLIDEGEKKVILYTIRHRRAAY